MRERKRILVVALMIVILIIAVISLPVMAQTGKVQGVIDKVNSGSNTLLAIGFVLSSLAAVLQMVGGKRLKKASDALQTASDKAQDIATKTQAIVAKISPEIIELCENAIRGAAGRKVLVIHVVEELNQAHHWGFSDEQIEGIVNYLAPLAARIKIPLR